MRFLYVDPTDIAHVRSMLVISALLSPLMIFGLDAAIGKLSRVDQSNLLKLLLAKDIFLFIAVCVSTNFLTQVIFLSSVTGLMQYVAAMKLSENKELSFLLISQLFTKTVILLSIVLLWIFWANKNDAVFVASLLTLLGCIFFANPLILLRQMKLGIFSSSFKSLSSNAKLIIPNLAALFLLDLMLRIPYLTATRQSSEIRNEYDVAVAFTSTWILPLLLKSRAIEIQAGYFHRKFLEVYRREQRLIFLQTLGLVIISVGVIVMLGFFGILKESVAGVLLKLPYCAAPVALCLLFPNVVRLFFLRNTFTSGAYKTLTVHIIVTVAALLTLIALGSSSLTFLGLCALLTWMNMFLRKNCSEHGSCVSF